MKPDEKELWKDIFQDSDEFLDNLENERSLITYRAERDGILVSAFHLFPVTIREKEEERKALYLIGAATRELYRRQGIMGSLIRKAISEQEEEILLYPAVRPFYESLGFTSPLFYRLPGYGKASSLSPDMEVDLQKLDHIYRNSMLTQSVVLRDERAWRCTLEDNFAYTTATAYALIDRQDKKVVETMSLDAEGYQELSEVLDYTFNRSAGEGNEQELFGMCSLKHKENLYIPEIY